MSVTFSNKSKKLIAELPKIELHIHIEGAIPLETLFHFVQRQGRKTMIKTRDDLRRKLTYKDFEHFIEVWVWKNSLIEEESDFEVIAYQVLDSLSRQNVKYVEAFYSPGDYRRKGLSVEGITEHLIRGKERAYNDFGIRCELIVDLIRDHGPEVGLQRLREVMPYVGKGVIGIGLGGSEQSFPCDAYASVYHKAREQGFRLTAHAGEVVGADSIWAAVEKLGVERIGHGVRAHEDPQLISLLKERQIPLEMCVISNLKTGVCKSIETHPIKDYFQRGLLVTVNSDDPTMFNTSMTQEYSTLVEKLDFSLSELKLLSINAIRASFMSERDKELMKSYFETEWQSLLSKYS